MIHNFFQVQDYLYSLISPECKKFPGKAGLIRMKHLLAALGNPQEKYPVIHIAGTSGKGSTCYILASILAAAGYKTGLHISPHVVSIRERMQINGKMITERTFIKLISRIRPVIDDVFKKEWGSVTYFEATAAASIQYFAEENVDIAVVETGLGGTYDGTNVLDSILSIITPIGFDHMHILGNTLQEIARNKAGIIKPSNRAVICSVQKKGVMLAIKHEAKKNKVKIIIQDKNFISAVKRLTVQWSEFDYEYKKRSVCLKNLRVPLLGRHQVHNAGLAITAVIELSARSKFSTDEMVIRNGLKGARIPGRLEIFLLPLISRCYVGSLDSEPARPIKGPRLSQADPHRHSASFIILDGAHNEDKVKALVFAVAELWPNRKCALVFACKKKKDVLAMSRILTPIIQNIYITKFSTGRDINDKQSMPTHTIARAFLQAGHHGKVIIETNSVRALQKAMNSSNDNDLILVTGSLYLVGEVREYLIKTLDTCG